MSYVRRARDAFRAAGTWPILRQLAKNARCCRFFDEGFRRYGGRDAEGMRAARHPK